MLEEFLTELNAMIEAQQRRILAGPFSEFTDYKHAVGELRGLTNARELLEECYERQKKRSA